MSEPVRPAGWRMQRTSAPFLSPFLFSNISSMDRLSKRPVVRRFVWWLKWKENSEISLISLLHGEERVSSGLFRFSTRDFVVDTQPCSTLCRQWQVQHRVTSTSLLHDHYGALGINEVDEYIWHFLAASESFSIRICWSRFNLFSRVKSTE